MKPVISVRDLEEMVRNGKDARKGLAIKEAPEDTHFHRRFRRDTLYTLAKNE